MIKVIIADDELKICELIYHIVDWKSLNMQIVAVAHDGQEALRIIQEYKPQIVITDIRMPGVNGVELIKEGKAINQEMDFIIISGYSQFEYAKKAIHYGVSAYLLKPIRESELLDALKKIRVKYDKMNYQEQQSNDYANLTKENSRFLRTQFLNSIFTENEELEEELLDTINLQYKFHFKNGLFQMVLIKADGIDSKEQSENDFLFDKMKQIISFEINGKVYEQESSCVKNGLFIFIFNYEASFQVELERCFRRVINQLLIQKDVIDSLHITMAIGSPVEQIQQVHISGEEAVYAIQERIVEGTDRIIYGESKDATNKYKDYFVQFTQTFESAVELLDDQMAVDLIRKIGKDMEQDKNLRGYDVLQTAKAIVNIYILVAQKNNYLIEDKDSLLENLTNQLDNCYTIKQVIILLGNMVSHSIQDYRDARRNEGTKPIRMAKDYIKKHLNETIALEEISEYVGYNATYFSTLFKKESGITFSDYVIQSRVNKAKEYLKDSNENIATIAQSVGYLDIKTFTKNFKKYTGLKPSQYRKLYG